MVQFCRQYLRAIPEVHREPQRPRTSPAVPLTEPILRLYA